MSKVIIATDKAPAAIGTYSQAVKIGTTVYLSGQIPLDPETMELVSEDFQQQAEQVFDRRKPRLVRSRFPSRVLAQPDFTTRVFAA